MQQQCWTWRNHNTKRNFMQAWKMLQVTDESVRLKGKCGEKRFIVSFHLWLTLS